MYILSSGLWCPCFRQLLFHQILWCLPLAMHVVAHRWHVIMPGSTFVLIVFASMCTVHNISVSLFNFIRLKRRASRTAEPTPSLFAVFASSMDLIILLYLSFVVSCVSVLWAWRPPSSVCGRRGNKTPQMGVFIEANVSGFTPTYFQWIQCCYNSLKLHKSMTYFNGSPTKCFLYLPGPHIYPH